jgi:hypothetical protein
MFNAYYDKSRGGNFNDGDIIGMDPDEFVSAYYGDETPDIEADPEQSTVISDNPRLRALAQMLISTAKDSRGKDDVGFRNAVREHNKIINRFADELLPDADAKTIDDMFNIINKYGKGNPSAFHATGFIDKVTNAMGIDFVSDMIKKYKIDMDANNLKKLQADVTDDKPKGEPFKGMAKLKKFIDLMMNVTTLKELDNMILFLKQKNIVFQPEDKKYIMNAIKNRPSDIPFIGPGLIKSWTPNVVYGRFRKHNVDVENLSKNDKSIDESYYFKDCYFNDLVKS